MPTDAVFKKSPLIDRLIDEARKHPLLTPAEEQALACRVQDGDEKAIEILVCSNIGMVVKISARYYWSGFDLEDIAAAGMMGLHEAARRYKPRSTRFLTYAQSWIRHSIQMQFEHARTIKFNHNCVTILCKMIDARNDFATENGRRPSIDELAEVIAIKPSIVAALYPHMEYMKSLNVTAMRGSDHPGTVHTTLMDMLVCPRDKPDAGTLQSDATVKIRATIAAKLRPREQEIITRRFGLDAAPETLQQISRRLGCTRERVRQIEKIALRKLARYPIMKELHEYSLENVAGRGIIMAEANV